MRRSGRRAFSLALPLRCARESPARPHSMGIPHPRQKLSAYYSILKNNISSIKMCCLYLIDQLGDAMRDKRQTLGDNVRPLNYNLAFDIDFKNLKYSCRELISVQIKIAQISKAECGRAEDKKRGNSLEEKIAEGSCQDSMRKQSSLSLASGRRYRELPNLR